jgi:hypothetical protein
MLQFHVNQQQNDYGHNKNAATPPIPNFRRRREMFSQNRTQRQSRDQPADVSRVVDYLDGRAKEQIVACKDEQASQCALNRLPGNRQIAKIKSRD